MPAKEPLPPPDLEAFLADVAKASGAGYTADQRYADFRQVFLSTQQGKRVLNQILSWARLYGPSYRMGGSIHDALFIEGNRNLGLRIFAAINEEPAPKPKRQARKPEVSND